MGGHLRINSNVETIARNLRNSKNPSAQKLISAIEAKYGKPQSDTYIVVLHKREELRANGGANKNDLELSNLIVKETGMDWGVVAMRIRYGAWDGIIPVNPNGSIHMVSDGI